MLPELTAAAEPESAGAANTVGGEPDVQGIWTNAYDFPCNSPRSYIRKAFFTDEERAALD